MPSGIDLRGGQVVISEKDRRAELSKAELLLSRDSKDVNNLVIAKFGRTTNQVYYFHRDILADGWECISGPKGLAKPQVADWPSAQLGLDRG